VTAALPLSPPVPRYRTAPATSRADVEAAQRLRSDADEWDEHCDHVLVRDEQTDAVVATCRLLSRTAPQHSDVGAATAGSTCPPMPRSARPWSR
jgi:hypothetical protein